MLSPGEIEVLKWLARGNSNAETARVLVDVAAHVGIPRPNDGRVAVDRDGQSESVEGRAVGRGLTLATSVSIACHSAAVRPAAEKRWWHCGCPAASCRCPGSAGPGGMGRAG